MEELKAFRLYWLTYTQYKKVGPVEALQIRDMIEFIRHSILLRHGQKSYIATHHLFNMTVSLSSLQYDIRWLLKAIKQLEDANFEHFN